jgi:hypothetical protein
VIEQAQHRQRMREDMYHRAIYWILRERAGSNNGWPPRDVSKVSGWAVVRMTAHLHGRSVAEVAKDLIDIYEHHGASV